MAEKKKVMLKIDAPEEKLHELVKRIVTDDDFQKEFEKNPREVLSRYGVEVPEEMIPEKLDVKEVIAAMEQTQSLMTRPAVGVAVAVVVAPTPTVMLHTLEKEEE